MGWPANMLPGGPAAVAPCAPSLPPPLPPPHTALADGIALQALRESSLSSSSPDAQAEEGTVSAAAQAEEGTVSAAAAAPAAPAASAFAAAAAQVQAAAAVDEYAVAHALEAVQQGGWLGPCVYAWPQPSDHETTARPCVRACGGRGWHTKDGGEEHRTHIIAGCCAGMFFNPEACSIEGRA